MPNFNCDVCGKDFISLRGKHVYKCDYCGSLQSVPVLIEEDKRPLYNEANKLRINGEYDKAISIYENILKTTSEDSAIYWSLVLATYGIKYVKNPITNQQVPVVNRLLSTLILDNENYKLALEYANGEQRRLYTKEANKINDIQIKLLDITGVDNARKIDVSNQGSIKKSDLEASEDVGFTEFMSNFISDSQNYREDEVKVSNINYSDLLNEIEKETTSNELLEKEYNNACYLLNESKNKQDVLDAYDIFNKLGDYKDSTTKMFSALAKVKELEEIEKEVEKKQAIYDESLYLLNSVNTKEELTKAYEAFIKLNNFKDSRKLSLECLIKVKQIEENEIESARKKSDYNKASDILFNAKTIDECNIAKELLNSIIEFKDAKNLVIKCDNKITEIEQDLVKKEQEKKQIIYDKGLLILNDAKTVNELSKAKSSFISIIDFKNAKDLVNKCDAQIKVLEEASQSQILKKERLKLEESEKEYLKGLNILNSAKSIEEFNECKKIFINLEGFKDSSDKIKYCDSEIVRINQVNEEKERLFKLKQEQEEKERLESKRKCKEYDKAINLLESANTVNECKEALEVFVSLGDFKDASLKVKACEEKQAKINQKLVEEEKARILELQRQTCEFNKQEEAKKVAREKEEHKRITIIAEDKEDKARQEETKLKDEKERFIVKEEKDNKIRGKKVKADKPKEKGKIFILSLVSLGIVASIGIGGVLYVKNQEVKRVEEMIEDINSQNYQFTNYHNINNYFDSKNYEDETIFKLAKEAENSDYVKSFILYTSLNYENPEANNRTKDLFIKVYNELVADYKFKEANSIITFLGSNNDPRLISCSEYTRDIANRFIDMKMNKIKSLISNQDDGKSVLSICNIISDIMIDVSYVEDSGIEKIEKLDEYNKLLLDTYSILANKYVVDLAKDNDFRFAVSNNRLLKETFRNTNYLVNRLDVYNKLDKEMKRFEKSIDKLTPKELYEIKENKLTSYLHYDDYKLACDVYNSLYDKFMKAYNKCKDQIMLENVDIEVFFSNVENPFNRDDKGLTIRDGKRYIELTQYTGVYSKLNNFYEGNYYITINFVGFNGVYKTHLHNKMRTFEQGIVPELYDYLKENGECRVMVKVGLNSYPDKNEPYKLIDMGAFYFE